LPHCTICDSIIALCISKIGFYPTKGRKTIEAEKELVLQAQDDFEEIKNRVEHVMQEIANRAAAKESALC
jgi:hypothetical protein